MSELPSDYHRRLPYGERLSAAPLLGHPFFPFEQVTVAPLAELTLPEPPRAGAPGGAECPTCVEPTKDAVWGDEQWLLKVFGPTGLPLVALLVSREHYRLDTLPAELTATLGPVLQRVAGAVGRIDGVGRTHINRWGDGSEHFHMWFQARPVGMMQLRGAGIAFWNDMLPNVPEAEFAANKRTVAAALGEGGGSVLPGAQ
ncbi:hypothetical protein HPO96_27820 [Kribbella sandramycini]|uniref:Diadenosine tetraphosphate (Ap4A) HIT family hydrolase n=1 Tax=Kribbella sandramycini TaxID=60450 RepID=A0A7Y4L481_9ACTN|nr:hypothetical protein [Kribbella sandramycini]MBB6570933.1 hypothetical protein [Kribbella sandramycini]NOL44063.1 hypothetical protein [Kribbella sandramycini]